ncbi:MAG TPA: dihydrolipoamide acetyltransferase family protein [Lentimicrobium sp.]|nr:dihydrolipoamide acetyltransferase family protein [Lentimicrobium sp.]
MAKFEVIMPKLGESIIEATITRWLKKPGDMIEEDDAIVEIATDKVDSEIPSPVEGKLLELKYKEGDVVEVGKIIAIIDTEPGEAGEVSSAQNQDIASNEQPDASEAKNNNSQIQSVSSNETVASSSRIQETDQIGSGSKEPATEKTEVDHESESDRFYSPLVKNIAKTEGISNKELESIKGTGKEGRLTKNDLLSYLENRNQIPDEVISENSKEQKRPSVQIQDQKTVEPSVSETSRVANIAKQAPAVTANQGDEIVEMDRMRRLIADHMVMSKQVSPHVTSFIEVDVTNMVTWREKIKDDFLKREKEKITFTPIFVEAATQAIKELPGVNASVDGYNVILRKNINIGIAAALPTGNLIVPVIKNADQKSLLGLAKEVNSLADKARKNKLNPDDIQGGTFTITNLGTFGSITGSPIINQPQVAILGLGVIKKKPVVLETEYGDVIAIRHMVILSLAYDHRVVDGALGGMFLQKLQQILERFDINRTI